MSAITAAVFAVILICNCLSDAVNVTGKADLRRFPHDFEFGSATGAYQVEGAWNEDGKSESIWDYLTHTDPCVIADCKNGDVATDSYHQYKRDVEMMRELGLDYHRFSIAWSRILPSGFDNEINYAGIQYYNNLIDEMLKYNIKPMVTIYHFDLPQVLQELGGIANPYFVDWFADYARVAFKLFGDRVKMWLTFNEPLQVCVFGYGGMGFAPLTSVKGIADYICAKNVMLAHAKAWHLYNEEFRSTQKGEVGYTVNVEWYEPLTDSVDDKDGTSSIKQFEWGQYIHLVFSATGDFPEVIKDRVAAKSIEQGYPRSRLPELSPDEIEYIRGSSDFLGVNTYSTKWVYRNETSSTKYDSPSFYDDVNALTVAIPGYPSGSTVWMQAIPWGFYSLLAYIKDNYNNPKVYITESGFGSLRGLEDNDRIYLYRSYLDALLDALEYGCNIKKYTAWSLMDNFEWLSGFTVKFGLYEVDFDSPQKTRTARKSALIYKEIIRSRVIDLEYEPPSLNITIDEGH